MIPMPLWFKLILGLVVFLLVTGTIRYIFKNRTLEIKQNYPKRKKEQAVKSYENQIKISKMSFFLLPFDAIVLMLGYIFGIKDLYYIAVTLFIAHLFAAENIFYSKMMLAELQS